MERKDFIEKVGLSSAAILIFGCMQSCSKEGSTNTEPIPPNTGGGGTTDNKIDFTIDIGVAPYNVLKQEGGFYVYNLSKIIIARTTANEIIAVSSLCTHQGATLEYINSTKTFFCPLHGSNFSQTGSVSNGPATQPLKQYKTSLDGNKLRVYE
jgi:cytochrome b6-f complex iron-sulfur subunit